MALKNHFKEITALLEDTHNKCPDLRFGQILQSAVDTISRKKNFDLHNISDKKLFLYLTQEDHRVKRVLVKNKRLDRLQRNKERNNRPNIKNDDTKKSREGKK